MNHEQFFSRIYEFSIDFEFFFPSFFLQLEIWHGMNDEVEVNRNAYNIVTAFLWILSEIFHASLPWINFSYIIFYREKLNRTQIMNCSWRGEPVIQDLWDDNAISLHDSYIIYFVYNVLYIYVLCTHKLMISSSYLRISIFQIIKNYSTIFHYNEKLFKLTTCRIGTMVNFD